MKSDPAGLDVAKLKVTQMKSWFSAFLVSPRSAIPNARPVRSRASCARVSGGLNAILNMGARTSNFASPADCTARREAPVNPSYRTTLASTRLFKRSRTLTRVVTVCSASRLWARRTMFFQKTQMDRRRRAPVSISLPRNAAPRACWIPTRRRLHPLELDLST